MPGYAAAAAAAMSAIQGAMASHGANKQRRRSRRQGIHAALQNKQLANRFGALTRSELEKGILAATGGFDTAKVEAGRFGRDSFQRVADSEETVTAQIQQALQNTGFGNNSSLAGNAARGVQADTQRAFQDIDARLGAINADLAIGRGQAESLGRSQIAGTFGTQSNQLMAANNAIAAAFGANTAPVGGAQEIDLGAIFSALFPGDDGGSRFSATDMAKIGQSSPSGAFNLDFGAFGAPGKF